MIKKASENHKMEYATAKEVELRNNYPDVLPFDYNRVILSTLPSEPHSHYVNASYVDVSKNANIDSHFALTKFMMVSCYLLQKL